MPGDGRTDGNHTEGALALNDVASVLQM